jgi:choline dehydrogenase
VISPVDQDSRQPDFIIVGAGSAGCVLASQLAQRHGFRVLVVEPPAGEAAEIDRQRPARWLNLLGSSEDWNLSTQASPQLAGRRLAWPRGKGPGGSSRINSMIWFPPTDRDFQMLIQASGDQWSKHELLQAYQTAHQLIAPERPRWLSASSWQFLAATNELSDATPMVYDRVNRMGRRWNPANLLSGLPIVRANVDRVLWDADRAIGVRVICDGSAIDILASRGVVLCAGAIASPTILMRSGIGERAALANHNIDVRIDREAVGKCLQDHLIVPVIFQTKATENFSDNPTTRDLARWQTMGQGPIGSNLAECGGLFGGDEFQLHVTPTNYLTFPNPSVAPVMTIGVNLTQPRSFGSLHLAEANPMMSPVVETGYLTNQADLESLVKGVELVRFLANHTSLHEWIVDEALPGNKRIDSIAIAKSISRYAQTLYHPVGTNHFGNQSDCVVDPEFRVWGTSQLWTVDASVLPGLTIGNPNATVMMLAILASDKIGTSAA